MKKRYAWPIVIVAVVVALVALRVALPGLARDYLNGQLADMGDYRGHIEDVDIHLWRGAYAIDGLDIVKTSGQVPVPFVRVETLDLSVSWRALWNGAIVAEAEFLRPELNFVDAEQAQNGRPARARHGARRCSRCCRSSSTASPSSTDAFTFATSAPSRRWTWSSPRSTPW